MIEVDYPSYGLEQLGEVFQGVLVQTRYGDHPLRIINGRDIQSGKIQLEPEQIQTVEAPNDLGKQLLQPLDVLITVRFQPVKVGLWEHSDDKTIAAQNVAVWRITDSKLEPAFAVLYFNSLAGQEVLNQAVSPSKTVPFLSLRDLRSIKLPVPPLETQHHLVQLSQSIREAEEITLKTLEARQQFLQAVIAQTLGGQ